jgi:hypothetical protein
VGYVAYMEMRNIYKILDGRPEGERPFRKPDILQDIIESEIREIVLGNTLD